MQIVQEIQSWFVFLKAQTQELIKGIYLEIYQNNLTEILMRERKMQNEHDYAWICKNFGVQGAAASYPCVYCLVHSQDLQIPPHTSKIKDAT